METTTLINGNGQPYTREVPKIVILGIMNEVAREHLCRNTGIDFKIKNGTILEGQPETWEQFAKVFLTYNFLTHDTNNMWGNTMYLRIECNVPLNAKLYYERDGQKILGVM